MRDRVHIIIERIDGQLLTDAQVSDITKRMGRYRQANPDMTLTAYDDRRLQRPMPAHNHGGAAHTDYFPGAYIHR